MTRRMVSLDKGGHRYVFRYPAGCENQVLDEIARLAERPQSNLDWLDAATLSLQITQRTADDCAEELKASARAEWMPDH